VPRPYRKWPFSHINPIRYRTCPSDRINTLITVFVLGAFNLIRDWPVSLLVRRIVRLWNINRQFYLSRTLPRRCSSQPLTTVGQSTDSRIAKRLQQLQRQSEWRVLSTGQAVLQKGRMVHGWALLQKIVGLLSDEKQWPAWQIAKTGRVVSQLFATIFLQETRQLGTLLLSLVFETATGRQRRNKKIGNLQSAGVARAKYRRLWTELKIYQTGYSTDKGQQRQHVGSIAEQPRDDQIEETAVSRSLRLSIAVYKYILRLQEWIERGWKEQKLHESGNCL
jgi:hypothetical protein